MSKLQEKLKMFMSEQSLASKPTSNQFVTENLNLLDSSKVSVGLSIFSRCRTQGTVGLAYEVLKGLAEDLHGDKYPEITAEKERLCEVFNENSSITLLAAERAGISDLYDNIVETYIMENRV